MQKEYKIKSTKNISPKYDAALGIINQTIEEFEIPEEYTKIPSNTFMEIANLKHIIIPKSIKEIGGLAFYGCENLINIEYKGTIEEWNNITLGNSVFGYSGASEITCTDGSVSIEEE